MSTKVNGSLSSREPLTRETTGLSRTAPSNTARVCLCLQSSRNLEKPPDSRWLWGPRGQGCGGRGGAGHKGTPAAIPAHCLEIRRHQNVSLKPLPSTPCESNQIPTCPLRLRGREAQCRPLRQDMGCWDALSREGSGPTEQEPAARVGSPDTCFSSRKTSKRVINHKATIIVDAFQEFTFFPLKSW